MHFGKYINFLSLESFVRSIGRELEEKSFKNTNNIFLYKILAWLKSNNTRREWIYDNKRRDMVKFRTITHSIV